jgi:hypothetical protein
MLRHCQSTVIEKEKLMRLGWTGKLPALYLILVSYKDPDAAITVGKYAEYIIYHCVRKTCKDSHLNTEDRSIFAKSMSRLRQNGTSET